MIAIVEARAAAAFKSLLAASAASSATQATVSFSKPKREGKKARVDLHLTIPKLKILMS